MKLFVLLPNLKIRIIRSSSYAVKLKMTPIGLNEKMAEIRVIIENTTISRIVVNGGIDTPQYLHFFLLAKYEKIGN